MGIFFLEGVEIMNPQKGYGKGRRMMADEAIDDSCILNKK